MLGSKLGVRVRGYWLTSSLGTNCPGLPARLDACRPVCLPARTVYRARQDDLRCRSSLHRKGYGAPYVSRDGPRVIRVAGAELTFRQSALDGWLQPSGANLGTLLRGSWTERSRTRRTRLSKGLKIIQECNQQGLQIPLSINFGHPPLIKIG